MATATARINATRKAKAAKAAVAKPAAKKQPAAKKAVAAEANKREVARAANLELAPKIKAAREAGTSWGDIKAKFGVDQSKGQILIKQAGLRPKDRIKFEDDADLKLQAILLRAEGLSYADIAVRADVSLGKIKQLIGEGWKAAPEKAAPEKKAPAKKAAGTKGKRPTLKGRGRGARATDPSVQS